MTHHIMNFSTVMHMVCMVLLTLYLLTVCVMTHTVVLVIQRRETALDRARLGKRHEAKDEDDESRYDEVIKYLEEFGE